MSHTFSLSTVKARLTSLIRGVQDREEEIIITKNGEPAAVIISYAELASMRETLDVLSDPELMDQVRKSRTFFKKRKKGFSFEDVFGESLLPQTKK